MVGGITNSWNNSVISNTESHPFRRGSPIPRNTNHFYIFFTLLFTFSSIFFIDKSFEWIQLMRFKLDFRWWCHYFLHSQHFVRLFLSFFLFNLIWKMNLIFGKIRLLLSFHILISPISHDFRPHSGVLVEQWTNFPCFGPELDIYWLRFSFALHEHSDLSSFHWTTWSLFKQVRILWRMSITIFPPRISNVKYESTGNFRANFFFLRSLLAQTFINQKYAASSDRLAKSTTKAALLFFQPVGQRWPV